MKEKTFPKRSFLVIVSLCILGAVIALQTIGRIQQKESGERCSAPFWDFSEDNVLGTWVAGVPSHMDTLIIKEGGTYKQIIHVEFSEIPPLDYESDWQPWHLEYSGTGIPYLHLEEFAFCGVNVNTPCEMRDGGGYDFCIDKNLPMEGEGILVVLEASETPPNSKETQFFYSLFFPI